jgi:DMSO/TMAO reductase YedYZ molybdopterin-dependent catalytic subunit
MKPVVFVLLVAALLVLPACQRDEPLPDATEDSVRDDAVQLDGVEVREYQGERLDSVQDFRENSIKGPQYVDVETYRLAVKGLVDSPAEYTYSEIASGYPSYEKVVQLDCVEGWSVKILWRGVLVRDILDDSGVRPEAESVIFRAADDYSTSFPVQYFYDNDILMAYSMNGVQLPPERGFPFHLVAEDKWGYKWCKWIVSMELSDDPDPGGFWEDRGYNNSGDLDTPFYAN